MARVHFGLVLLLFPALVLGQSLGDVAREEKERREGNRERGEKAQLVIGDIGAAGENGDAPRPALVGTTSTETPPSPRDVASPRASVEGDRAQQEMEWRRRNRRGARTVEAGEETTRAPQQAPSDNRHLLRGLEQHARHHLGGTGHGCTGQERVGCGHPGSVSGP